tara:strand:+ start:4671 stop:5159 length:489 start_codon:yes stop_codon:yes gene_type:complete
MKNILILILFSFSINTICSQEKDSSIYIYLKNLDDVKLIKADDNQNNIQLFILKESINRIKTSIVISDKGIIEKRISVPSYNKFLSQITLKYESKSGKNVPFLVKHDNVKNLLVYPDDFGGIEFNELVKELQKVKTIYIIDGIYPDIYYKAKKVSLDIKPKM